ncbi:MAG: hypothetical protein A2X86_13125 [Bdellovibrionales bacterium GWA2_49_15]|nr:MAG: hypothetical protein A2X86_13125 [Bdellovibrionales bacterium GWA2_49_15]
MYQISLNILVVEDDRFMEALVRHMTKNISNKIMMDWDTTVDAALKRCKAIEKKLDSTANFYDLVLIDIYTPGEATGIDLYKYIQENLSFMPCVMMSSMSVAEYCREIDQLSLSRPPFLAKPFYLQDLRQVIDNILLPKSFAA